MKTITFQCDATHLAVLVNEMEAQGSGPKDAAYFMNGFFSKALR